MPEPEPSHILVLGPMRPTERGDEQQPSPRTDRLVKLIRSMCPAILAVPNRRNAASRIEVEGPGTNPYSDIVSGILTKIERADLAVIDLTGQSPNVMYEIGLVHALGIPYIVVSRDAEVPFYLRMTQSIMGLELTDSFDQRRPGQSALLDRLRQFYGDPALTEPDDSPTEAFATNSVTAFYDGLPIVDISAPAGLAAGYWQNAVLRFVRKGGYFDPPARRVTRNTRTGIDALDEMDLVPEYFVAVAPSDLNETVNHCWNRVSAVLDPAGFTLIEAGIHQSSADDMRVFGAKFLAMRAQNGPAVLASPAVVVDVPTTVFALQYSPRMMTIDSRLMQGARGYSLDIRQRRYRLMIERFQVVLRHLAARSESRGHERQVRFVTLERLAETLREIAAQPRPPAGSGAPL